MNVHSARNVSELAGELLPNQIILALIHTRDFHVDRRGGAEIQDLSNDIRRLEEKLYAWKTLRQHFTQLIDIGPGGLATFIFQLHENFRVGCPDRAAVAVGQIAAA